MIKIKGERWGIWSFQWVGKRLEKEKNKRSKEKKVRLIEDLSWGFQKPNNLRLAKH